MRMKLVIILMLGCLCILTTQAMAASVTMTANDDYGTTSFNAAGKWSDGLAPSAGNDYSTLGYLLRSPTSAGDFTFAGDSLTVGGGTGGGAFDPLAGPNNNSLIFKAADITLTVDNLILDASTIRDGLGDGQHAYLNGNINVTSNGGMFQNQCLLNIDSAISGPGPIYIGDNGNGNSGRTIIFTSSASTYAGNIIMSPASSNDPNRARLDLAAGSVMNFDIGASGVNNSVSGIGTLTLEGAFNIDLTSASNAIGDSWLLVDGTNINESYAGTFSVTGFTDIGSDFWNKSANGVTYQFNEATNTLTVVPEPASIVMILTGLFGMGLLWLRKK